MTDPAINPDLRPYGAWYTRPGGLSYHDPASIPAAIHEARTRLRRLRQPAHDEPKVGSLRNAAIQFAVAGVQLIALAIVLLVYRQASSRDASYTTSLQTPILLAFNAVLFLGNGIRMALFPPTRKPEAMFRHYLLHAIGAWRGLARRQLTKGDAESTRPREVPAMLGKAKDERETHAFVYAFSQYWEHAFGSGWGTVRTTRFKGIRSVEVARDVVVVEADLVVRARRLWLILCSQVPMVLGAIAMVVVVIVKMSTRDLPKNLPGAFALLGLTIGIGILLTMILTVFAFIPKERQTFTVRKILVSVNGQWRVFNGELQGAEEHDISWLYEAYRPEYLAAPDC